MPIRPSHWRYERAKRDLIERGIAPTVTALAKAIGISRLSVYRLLWRYPWLDEWVNERALEANVHLWGLVERRHGMLGIQGSTASAEVYAKMQRGVYGRAGAPGDPDAGSVGGAGITVTNNFLVPRPDYAGAAAALPPAIPAAPAPAKIPEVRVR